MPIHRSTTRAARVGAALTIAATLAVSGCGGGGSSHASASASSSRSSGSSSGSSSSSSSSAPSTTAPATTTTATTTPDTGHHLANPCEDSTIEFRTGVFTVDGPGTADTVTAIDGGGDDTCARVSLHFNGTAPDLEITRHKALDTTVVKIVGSGEPQATADPSYALVGSPFAHDAFVSSNDHTTMGATIISLPNVTTAVHVEIGQDEADLYFRGALPTDPASVDVYDGEPFQEIVSGQPNRGLIVGFVDQLEGGPSIAVEGWLQAFEGMGELDVDNGDGGHCQKNITGQGISYFFSHFTVTCDGLAPGTYDVTVGFSSASGDPANDVFSHYEVEVRA